MGVIDTKKWLEGHFDDPIEICRKLLGSQNQSIQSDNQNKHQYRNEAQIPRVFYRYLQKFGMYRPSKLSYSSFEELKERQVWSTVHKLFKQYKQKWRGPDVPVYIFPFTDKQELFFRPTAMKNKSGLSFHDKLFLFLTPNLTKKDIEALFVHEYHHVCRMNQIDKGIEDYTLLDSIILEGLAEAVVEAECGADYVAPWCTRYSEKQIEQYWKMYIAENMNVKKEDSLHDKILFGERGIPNMLGYAAGFIFVKKYYKKMSFSIADSFAIEAAEILEELDKL